MRNLLHTTQFSYNYLLSSSLNECNTLFDTTRTLHHTTLGAPNNILRCKMAFIDVRWHSSMLDSFQNKPGINRRVAINIHKWFMNHLRKLSYSKRLSITQSKNPMSLLPESNKDMGFLLCVIILFPYRKSCWHHW